MQTLLSILLSSLWLFGSGAVVFAILLPKWFEQNFHLVARDKKDFKFIPVLTEKILQSVGITLLVKWTVQPVIVLTAIPLLLISCTYLLQTYSTYKVEWRPVCRIALIDSCRIIVAVIIAGLIFSREII
ncbi:hypothetical protein [Chitinophaga eiseniae]|uniref:Uncharacterized protein n=1 Tax=Chitinophaga eiseniae TaxID=634771 RepID=A0A847SDY8_9BACT|nr:hypothetical protein [Chitinophaga eiseniae]NLR77983.1 hypothetical protein [Chitinophaga eiseniae]